MTTILAAIGLLALGAALGYLLAVRRRPADAAASDIAALLAPAAHTMARVEQRLGEVERDRVGAYAGLREQVGALYRASTELGTQTRSLVGALRAPTVRGRWGELQLQRIVELAGMVEHCDFDTQVARAGDGTPGVRPDMLIRLDGGRSIPVDAKVPFQAWLDALEAPDEAGRRRLMTAHARALRAHVDSLAAKEYWRHFQPAPDFVVLFVPGEPLLDAAMIADPGLAEHAFGRHIIIATPTTLIALLRTIAFGWRQHRLSESAEAILDLGSDLYRRLGAVGGHLTKLGASLGRAVESYNAAVGSIEGRVLSTARRLRDLGVSDGELATVEPIDRTTRIPRAPESGPGPSRPPPVTEEPAWANWKAVGATVDP